MMFAFDEWNCRRDDNRTMAVAVSASVLVHLVLLSQNAVIVHRPSPDLDRLGAPRGPLVVDIVPPTATRAPAPAREAPPAARSERRPAPAPKSARRPPARPSAPAPRASPPVIARNDSAPQPSPVPAPPAEPAASAPPARAAAGEDLSSYIESRRRARAETAPALPFPDAQPQAQPGEDANARASRLAAANLAAGRAPQTFGYDPNRGGGVFSIRHVAYDYAEFMFYGWNREAKRNTAQLVEVRRGDNPDIRLAVVRRMIAIIREHEKADFVWESPRLGRYVRLSARPQDGAALEAFLMEEFFDDLRRVR